MDWTAGIQNAINYIENNITEELTFAEISEQACSSNFYFQRVFSTLCGCSLGEYIRNRRLTLAGSELSATDSRIIDIAMKYGYDSPESFTRAFSRFHGITPSEAKKDGSKLKSFSRLSVQIILEGGSIMDYRIEEKDAFKVLEKAQMQNIDDSQNINTIPDFWTDSFKDGTVEALLKQTPDRSFIFGICYGNEAKDCKTFDYSIAALYGGGEIPAGFRITEIPNRTWAVFPCRGKMPDAIQQTWHKICSEFFPTAAYRPTYEMTVEAYAEKDMSSDSCKSEIWVPLKK